MTNHYSNLTELMSFYNIGNKGKKQCSGSDNWPVVAIILLQILTF